MMQVQVQESQGRSFRFLVHLPSASAGEETEMLHKPLQDRSVAFSEASYHPSMIYAMCGIATSTAVACQQVQSHYEALRYLPMFDYHVAPKALYVITWEDRFKTDRQLARENLSLAVLRCWPPSNT